MILFSGFDGILADVYLDQPESWGVILDKASPLFPMSPTEKQVALQVVQQLVLLGVDPAYALATEYYTSMSPSTIQKEVVAKGGLTTREKLVEVPNNTVPRSSKELPTKN
jgi:hypothetical protein